MIKRIIVEGADQQGKTTLCQHLCKQLGWPIIHFGKPTEDFDFLKDYFTPDNTICDRSFLSEVVYSKINNRPSLAPHHALQTIMKGDTLLILMDRQDYFYFDDMRHEEYSKMQIINAINIYREEYEKIFLDKVLLNANSFFYNEEVQQIIDRINGNL